MSDTIQGRLRGYGNSPGLVQDREAAARLMRDAAEHIDTLLDKTRIQQEYIEGLPSTPDGSHYSPGDSLETELAAKLDEFGVRAELSHKDFTTIMAAAHRLKHAEMTHDERIRGLEEAVSGLQGNPPSEWLTLPWGGAVRKSEVSAAVKHVDPLTDKVYVRVWRGEAGHESPSANVAQCKAWLADIERQLGIVR